MSAPDPTRMRDQPALRTSSGRGWLAIGGISAVLLVVMFTLLLGIAPALAASGVGAVVLAFVLMCVVRLAVHDRPARLRSLAVLYVAMLGAALILAVAIVLIAQRG